MITFIAVCRRRSIDQCYWSINLEQVYATILYYLHNKEEVHLCLTEWIEHGERMREEQERRLSFSGYVD